MSQYLENEMAIEEVPFVRDSPALQNIYDRSTLRKFDLDRPLTEEEEQVILHAAVRAPSASNLMRWSVIVVRSPEKRQKMMELCGGKQKFIGTAPYMLVFCADFQRMEDMFRHYKVPEKCQEKNQAFWMRDPCGLILSTIDCSFAAHQAVLAAEALGIGSCCIGHVLDDIPGQRELLNLPQGVVPVLLLVMGHPAPGTSRVRREHFKQKYIVFNNGYERLTPDELEDMYESWSYSEKNLFGAENKGQQFYLQRYRGEVNDYTRSANSVYKELVNNWFDPEGFGKILDTN